MQKVTIVFENGVSVKAMIRNREARRIFWPKGKGAKRFERLRKWLGRGK
jgi:hypothetical protein